MPVRLNSQNGVTLVELIISMVIISIAVTGVFTVMNYTVSHSADPLMKQQAIAIAEAYMEEILLQAYDDPNGSNVGETRASYDNVDDYRNLNDIGAHDQHGVAVGNLTEYKVGVAVDTVTITGITDVQQVTVTVSAPGVTSLSLVGYKFNY